MSGTALLEQFSAFDDPRQAWKVVYPLPEVLLTVLCGTMAGAENFVEIERWATRKLDFLRRLLPFKRGIALHDTLNDVINGLPATLFSACFVSWVEALRERDPDMVAIDGKTSRRDRRSEAHPLHLVSAPPRPAGRVSFGDRIDGLLTIDGPDGSASCSARRRSPPRATRSWPSRSCSNGSSSRAPLSPSMPSAASAPSPRPSAPRGRTTSSPSRTTGPRLLRCGSFGPRPEPRRRLAAALKVRPDAAGQLA